MGQQAVAEREYALLGEDISESNRDLVLRKPQLAQARATQEAAAAALDLSRLNLERTTVKAPFNCSIRVRNVNVGMQVTANTPLATVTGSDEYWVELTVPVDQLRWLRIPNNDHQHGSIVSVTSESSRNGRIARQGQVLRLLPDLEPNGRLARILVSVMDPLALDPENSGKPPLILGDYVRAEIEGVGVADAIALDRRLFRDGDQVWVMNAEQQLEIRPVTVAFRGPETLLVTAGLETGEQIILTDLPAAVEGMALRTPEDRLPQARGDGADAGRGGGDNSGGGDRP
jgi:RND family efflux transporter MFP subunit